MHYMIVFWNRSALQWEIVHYSHCGIDARRIYALRKEQYGKENVRFMIDINHIMADRAQQLSALKAVREEYKEEESLQAQGGSF